MNNTMYEIDYTRALPPKLKNDKKMFAIAQTIANDLQENVRLSRINIIYARIDELDENVLDILGHDLHVDWYDYRFPIAVKRELLKTSVKVHKRLGTVYAVKTVVSSIYKQSEIKEWFEYAGEPYFFRVNATENAFISKDTFLQLITAINLCKNVRSWLESIQIKSEVASVYYSGGAVIADSSCIEISARTIQALSFESETYTGGAVVADSSYIEIPVRTIQEISFANEMYVGSAAIADLNISMIPTRIIKDMTFSAKHSYATSWWDISYVSIPTAEIM